MNGITVRHSHGSYEVVFCSLNQALTRLPEDSFILTDENVARIVDLRKHRYLVLPPGEPTKSLRFFGECQEWLVEQSASRSSTVVALGGGVIGDLAGFVAASYMRGIRFVQVPTSLLAQVDSSVGGKVGIDLPQGKNLVGAFKPPEAVFVSVSSLQTLPRREFTNGMAEVWKYGFILDAGLVQDLSNGGAEADSPDLESIIRRCIELKALVVEEDEFETTGRRAVLNFGHTVGHALEKLTGYSDLLHGEAISVGMVVESKLGERLGISKPGVADTVRRALLGSGLPATHPLLRKATSELLDAMRSDKKANQGELAFALLTEIGASKLVKEVPEDEVRAALLEA